MNADRVTRLRQCLAATVVDFVKEGDLERAQKFAEIDTALEEAVEIIESRWPTNIEPSMRIPGWRLVEDWQ